jgi:hypothetical protein
MDAIAEQALTALNAAVTSMLPAAVPVGLSRQVRVIPLKVSATGIGAYIGLQLSPQASVYGRRVEATVQVSVSGGADDLANAHVDQVAGILLAQDRIDLRQKGIYQLKADGFDARSVQFQILFEYAFHPVAGEGVIADLNLALELNNTPYRARFIWEAAAPALAALPAPLADFAVADDPDVNAGSPASQWVFNVASQRIEQNAAVRGGPLGANQPKKAGAQLLWRPGGAPLALSKFMVAAEFESGSPDGVGLVFHRQDDQNFCYFLASQSNQYHLFGRKQAGAYSILGQINNDAGFELDKRLELKIISHDGRLIAMLNDKQTLAIDAGENLLAGELGFLTHGNNRARFYRARVIGLVPA